MSTNSKVFRSEWPKITLVEGRGKPISVADARKKGGRLQKALCKGAKNTN
jgi:hypothetical protein